MRDQLEHAIRTACQIIGRPEVIVVGFQSILGTYREDQLPAEATMSVEIDILPVAADHEETARLADLIEGVAGEFSAFEELHGFSIDGVDLDTSAPPAGWRDRLVKVQNANTAGPSGQPQFTGWWDVTERPGEPLRRAMRVSQWCRAVAVDARCPVAGRTSSPGWLENPAIASVMLWGS